MIKNGLLNRALLRPSRLTHEFVFLKPYQRVNFFSSGVNGFSKQKSPSISKFGKFLIISAGGLTVGYLIDKYYLYSAFRRSLRTVVCLASIAIDYKFRFTEESDVDALNQSNANKLFDLLSTNKGLYIKLGQTIAMQATLFPKVYQQKFNLLFDNAPKDEWSIVNKTLESELGSDYYETIFSHIDEDPFASASIAQVHKGVLKNGEVVAIKVQHDAIPKQVNIDLFTYRFMMKIYGYLFDMPLDFITAYVSKKVSEETNFENELKNSLEMQNLLQHDDLAGKVYVPVAHPEISTKKVLVCEFIDGTSLIHPDELERKGFSLQNIMKNMLVLYSKQIFKWGLIHCDPHPGNFLVRFVDGKQQLVILDHGLYIKLDTNFRKNYCLLWKSLIEFDMEEVKRIVSSWGIGSPDLFSSMVMMKRFRSDNFEEITSEKEHDLSEFERNNIIKNRFLNFFENTDKFPLSLIFLGKTMRMMQALNQKFGSPCNRINILGNEAIKNFIALNEGPLGNKSTRITLLRRAYNYLVVHVVLQISSLIFYIIKAKQIIMNRIFNDKNSKGSEDILEDQLVYVANSFGVEIDKNQDILAG
ncbi:hypothetical protein PACTADRAFT_281 [Pachysolen tannophilus NRRL Y-2460]|uniref:ABC1 atypical kinase-like domain-containing protein n=1 Tax=Pachysolen tannophilus NRRL Y-2460 TaxID=669874 RepID=A0A1E4U1B1_PACTA|nr:hypothetical protein PACTADRAFT_281 [Pachysolen tannophilus NRRL Y-2460]